jgi:hypothetical protein
MISAELFQQVIAFFILFIGIRRWGWLWFHDSMAFLDQELFKRTV